MPTITRTGIRRIQGLAHRHPVWLVTCEDPGSTPRRFVLKVEQGDQGGPDAARFAGMVMGVLSPGVSAEVVEQEEMLTLVGLPRSVWASAEDHDHFMASYALARRAGGGRFLIKLPFERGLHDIAGATDRRDREGLDRFGDEYEDKDNRRKARVLLFTLLPAIKDPQSMIMYRLGKITVADLFTGNNDRITCDDCFPDEARSPEHLAELLQQAATTAQLVNHGNVIFQLGSDATYSPIGLDFYDPSNSSRAVHTALADGALWTQGELLKDEARIFAFARSAKNQMNAGFAKTLTFTNHDSRGRAAEVVPGAHELLDDACAIRYAEGMIAGLAELKRFLQERQWPNGMPAGMRSRMQYLGW